MSGNKEGVIFEQSCFLLDNVDRKVTSRFALL